MEIPIQVRRVGRILCIAKISTKAAEVIFYNAESGLGLTTKDEYENFATVSTTQMTQGWTHVVQIDASNKLLFYNSNSGLAVITNGDLVTVLNRTIAAGWTHIISLGTNILFYDANTGAGTVTNASFQTVSTHAMSGGWTHIVRLQRGVLFYNSNTGLAVLTNTRTLGNIQTYTFAAGWTHILPPESCNQVFFYNATTAAGTVTDANFRTLSTHAMSGGWTTILGIAILL